MLRRRQRGACVGRGRGAAADAHRRQPGASAALLLAGGLCAVAFLASQLWAWQTLLSAQVVTGLRNPAGSFFYLLTATARAAPDGRARRLVLGARRVAWKQPASGAWRIGLCARYWHFMLAVWLALVCTAALDDAGGGALHLRRRLSEQEEESP